MLAAVLGTILPPMLILGVISYFYAAFAANRYVALTLRGMQAGVAAVILDVVCDLGGKVIKNRSPLQLFVMSGVFAAAFLFDVNVMLLILAAGAVGGVSVLWRTRKGART